MEREGGGGKLLVLLQGPDTPTLSERERKKEREREKE